jgi:hypothetical protein
MSYSIVQDLERRKLAVSLQQKAGILSICLIESTARCKSALSENGGVPFSLATEFRPESSECNGTSLNVTTRFSFKIIRDKDKAEIIVLNCLRGLNTHSPKDSSLRRSRSMPSRKALRSSIAGRTFGSTSKAPLHG